MYRYQEQEGMEGMVLAVAEVMWPMHVFSCDIFPVIVSHCATTGCHDAISHKEGYNYTTYANIMNSVAPGNPGSSRLYRVISTPAGNQECYQTALSYPLHKSIQLENGLAMGLLMRPVGKLAIQLIRLHFPEQYGPLCKLAYGLPFGCICRRRNFALGPMPMFRL